MTDNPVAIRVVRGSGIAEVIPALAALRIQVFRDWPYLYDGDEAYEATYLRSYAANEGAVVVVAEANQRVIGAATAMPLLAHSVSHSTDVLVQLRRTDVVPETVFYLGESVLDPAWRGRGVGHAFFDQRERVGSELNFSTFAFCAVERAADHRRRPAMARDLTAFWRKRGYEFHPEISTAMQWKDLDDARGTESTKRLSFWIKAQR